MVTEIYWRFRQFRQLNCPSTSPSIDPPSSLPINPLELQRDIISLTEIISNFGDIGSRPVAYKMFTYLLLERWEVGYLVYWSLCLYLVVW